MAPYKSHLNIKRTSQAKEELCRKSVVGSIKKKQPFETAVNFYVVLLMHFREDVRRRDVFFLLKEMIWLKSDLVRDMYRPQATHSRTLACLSFLSHILTVSAERVLKSKDL